jgi:hypothetical protein
MQSGWHAACIVLLAGTHNRGELIMNSIHKAAALVIAFAITLAGATFATAPLALAHSQSIASTPHAAMEQVLACSTCSAPVGIADRY